MIKGEETGWEGAALKAPFPWFGGKSRVAKEVWRAFGAVNHYIEPFAGSLAVLLGCPRVASMETVNDVDGFICNFWRALQAEPEAVAYYADYPVNELDLNARNAWLARQRELLTARLLGDHQYYDVIIAGYWVWGVSQWIGGGFTSPGPWVSVDGVCMKNDASGIKGVGHKMLQIAWLGEGVHRGDLHDELPGGVGHRMPQIAHAGKGVHRGDLQGELPRGVGHTMPLINVQGAGVNQAGYANKLVEEMQKLSARLRYVRVVCGDWRRVLTTGVFHDNKHIGVFLDPPYSHAVRGDGVYHVDEDIAGEVRQWAIDNGINKNLKIAFCGYEGEHEMPKDWTIFKWRGRGGMAKEGSQAMENRSLERVWFSPHCLDWDKDTLSLFGD